MGFVNCPFNWQDKYAKDYVSPKMWYMLKSSSVFVPTNIDLIISSIIWNKTQPHLAEQALQSLVPDWFL